MMEEALAYCGQNIYARETRSKAPGRADPWGPIPKNLDFVNDGCTHLLIKGALL